MGTETQKQSFLLLDLRWEHAHLATQILCHSCTSMMTVKALQVLIWGLKYILILVNRQINKYESLNDEERYQFELIAANYFPTLVLVSGEGNGNALQYS